jgi:high-affinity K+ transport system ATPase subunit B
LQKKKKTLKAKTMTNQHPKKNMMNDGINDAPAATQPLAMNNPNAPASTEDAGCSFRGFRT